MKILITGCCGFIGSNTADEAIKRGYDVIGVDNFSNSSCEYLNKTINTYKADILNARKLNDIFKKEVPDYVIHLAAHINLRKSINNPFYDAQQNILGSINVLECCRKFDVKKIIYASSAAVYGIPKYIPVDEQHSVNPQSPYGISKHTVEHYIDCYNNSFGLSYVTLRYSNVYGKRQNYVEESDVISKFVDKLTRGESPTIFGDGNQTRDFIYVNDVAKANLLAIEAPITNKIFNISSNTECSIGDLVKKLRDIVGSDIDAIYLKQVDEIRNIRLDNRSAKSDLNWVVNVKLNDGLNLLCCGE